jgi:hypothetical protein
VNARTQEEILARIEAIDDEDFFGFRREVLIAVLDYEHARQFLKEGTTPEEWAEEQVTDVEAAAFGYYGFALGKIRDHRGISANRSVDKLAEYAWLLGRDDVAAAMDAAEFPQYGAPKVAAFAKGFGLDWPTEVAMVRMSSGLPCEDGCMDGCGA